MMSTSILEELREYIRKNDITYESIARKAGLSKQLVWYYLNGRRPGKIPDDIKLGNLERICKALGLRLQITIVPDDSRKPHKAQKSEK